MKDYYRQIHTIFYTYIIVECRSNERVVWTTDRMARDPKTELYQILYPQWLL